MSKQAEKWFFNRTFIVFIMVVVWFLGALSLHFFYHQQLSGYQQSIYSQISQRVRMSSVLQAELIDKEFSFLAANLKQLGSLTVDSPGQVSAFALRLKSLNSSIWHITIADGKGEVTFSTREGYQPSISARDYFIEHTKSNQSTFFISSPRQSVIQDSALYVAMSYPIRNNRGELRGVVLASLTSSALTAQLGKITKNNNISAVLTDQFGKLIWSSNLVDEQQKGDIYSLCKDNKYQSSTDFGIYRVKLDDNSLCDVQLLERWGMFSIVAENLAVANQLVQRHQNQMVKRNIIILLTFTLLLMILGYQLLRQIESRKLLAVLNQRNKAIIDAMPDLLLTMRLDGTIIDYEAEENFPLPFSAEKLNGMNISEILEPELVQKKLALIADTILTGEPETLEYPLTIEGKEFYFLERLTALDDKHVLAFIIDITSRRETESKLEWQAYHDGLTGLANRLMFFEFINKLIQDYRRNKREFTVLFIDLNGFKAINDSYGHHAGDEILLHVAKQLNKVLRQTDTVARLGGDEFAVLLPETSSAQAQRVIKTIAEAIQQPHMYMGNRLYVTASIGMASCPQDATSADELVNLADKHMYEVKLDER